MDLGKAATNVFQATLFVPTLSQDEEIAAVLLLSLRALKPMLQVSGTSQ